MIPTAICEMVATTSMPPAAIRPASAVVILAAPARLRDHLLRRSVRDLSPAAVSLVRVGFLAAWLSASVCGFWIVLARNWHGQLRAHGPARAPTRHQQSICLQSPGTLPASVPCPGISLGHACLNRPPSGLVVVRCSGQRENGIIIIVQVMIPATPSIGLLQSRTMPYRMPCIEILSNSLILGEPRAGIIGPTTFIFLALMLIVTSS